MTVSSIDIHDRRWSDFVGSRSDATPFHDAAWIGAVADCYGFRPFALIVERRGEIVAGVPAIELGTGRRRRWVSLPFTDRCDPLLTPEIGAHELAAALEETRQAEGVSRIELRVGLGGRSGHSVPCGYWHELELNSDADVLRRGFHQLRRRMLARASDGGVVSRTSVERTDLCSVFFDLHVATRKRLGVPVQPRRLFELLWERMIAPGKGFVQVAYLGQVPIAAGVFLTSGSRVTNKFAARDERYASAGGTDAMYWGAIQWGCEAGRRVFDFGRTEAANDGLRKFKRGWGTSEEELAYTVFAARPPSVGRGRSTVALASVIRNSPAWVARLVGHAAYRYAA
jgi:CelD/BcsL family acetyltransferase involved in cellulose biosynthesis